MPKPKAEKKRPSLKDKIAAYRPARVEPVPGEPLVYRVESRSRPGEWHQCNMNFNQGHGWCSCETFGYNHDKAITAGAPLFTDITRCFHLKAVHEYWAERCLRAAAAKIKLQLNGKDI